MRVEATRARGRAAAKAKDWAAMAAAYRELAKSEEKDWPLYMEEGMRLVQAGDEGGGGSGGKFARSY